MRKLLISTSVAFSMMPTVFSANAAETATLGVKGTIAISTCDVSLSDTTIDLGRVSKADLSKDFNAFSPSGVTIGLNCDAASNVALLVTDNRSSSAITNADLPSDSISGVKDSEIFGLGKDSASKNIGLIAFAPDKISVDSANGYLMQSTDKSTWSLSGRNMLQNNTYISLAATSSATAPSSFTTASITLIPIVGLFGASRYPSGEETVLDGSVTFTVNYL